MINRAAALGENFDKLKEIAEVSLIENAETLALRAAMNIFQLYQVNEAILEITTQLRGIKMAADSKHAESLAVAMSVDSLDVPASYAQASSQASAMLAESNAFGVAPSRGSSSSGPSMSMPPTLRHSPGFPRPRRNGGLGVVRPSSSYATRISPPQSGAGSESWRWLRKRTPRPS